MNNRLQQFLSAENLTQAQFADSINVARASISHILAGRNNPGYDFIINTMKRYPDLNIEWLLIGKGKMYRTARQEAPPASNEPMDATTAPASEIPDLDLGLFPELSDGSSRAEDGSQPSYDRNQTVQESSERVYSTASNENNGFSTGIASVDKHIQSSARQRKATKIIIFYDDGTYQEF